MSHLLDQLNAKQQEAVAHVNGPLLIIAGAGSGKTRALTHRIAYQIEQGISPWQILAVTFTNKAAQEMKNRLTHLLGPKMYDLPTMGTFHAVCVKILRKHIHVLDFENNFLIYDEADQLALMKQLMRDRGVNEKKCNPRAILSHISGAKNELMGPEQYRRLTTNYFTEQVAELYPIYQELLRKNGALDFDDILMKTVELFLKDAAILDYFQEKWRYISVDEYQDTNHCQYFLINLLAKKYKNLCVIGDSDQSIYSWRGADIRNILDFEKDYPEAKVIKLEQNYRSSSTILEAAHHVIVKNKQRKDKKLWTEKAAGAKIKLWTCDDAAHEGELILEEIRRQTMNQEQPIFSDFVVLYRTNAQSRVLEEVFLRAGIPYKIVGGVRFYQRKEIKDLLAYLRIIQNPNDDVSLLRIINVPPRNIGPKTLERLQNHGAQRKISLFETLSQLDQIPDIPDGKKDILKKWQAKWRELLKINKQFAVAGVIKTVLHYTGYKEFLLDGTPEGEARFENVQELISVAAKYDKLEPGISLVTFLEEVALISDLDQVDDKENAVTLMTLHAVKGLEFPQVFMVGLEEGVFPHSRSLLSPEELEEERRLMYVGMTRAMDCLYLLHAKERLLYGENRANAPSRFIQDIPVSLLEHLEENEVRNQRIIDYAFGTRPIPLESVGEELVFDREFNDGDRVHHPLFGDGVVVTSDERVITVAFRNPLHGIKRLAAGVAPLQKTNKE